MRLKIIVVGDAPFDLLSDMIQVHRADDVFVTACSHSPLLAIESVLLGNFVHPLRFCYRASLPHSRNSKKQEARSKKQEARSKKKEARSKKKEARSKKQEERSKKQEARSKKQEARSKKQEARSKKPAPATNSAQRPICTV